MILRHRTDKYLVILITALREKKGREREREREGAREGREEGGRGDILHRYDYWSLPPAGGGEVAAKIRNARANFNGNVKFDNVLNIPFGPLSFSLAQYHRLRSSDLIIPMCLISSIKEDRLKTAWSIRNYRHEIPPNLRIHDAESRGNIICRNYRCRLFLPLLLLLPSSFLFLFFVFFFLFLSSVATGFTLDKTFSDWIQLSPLARRWQRCKKTLR